MLPRAIGQLDKEDVILDTCLVLEVERLSFPQEVDESHASLTERSECLSFFGVRHC